MVTDRLVKGALFTLQKTPFWGVKDALLHCKRASFTMQKGMYWNLRVNLLYNKGIFSHSLILSMQNRIHKVLQRTACLSVRNHPTPTSNHPHLQTTQDKKAKGSCLTTTTFLLTKLNLQTWVLFYIMNVLNQIKGWSSVFFSISNGLMSIPLKDNAKLRFCLITSKFFCENLYFILKMGPFVFTNRKFLRLLRLTFTLYILL